MRYGHLSDDGREFIITRPDTPRPWVNCLTNGLYSSIISQTGGGYSFVGGPGYDRITRADADAAATDRPGRYIFVRDNASEEYFSIGWQPTKRTPERFECRHTPGTTTISSLNLGLAGRILFFVTLDDNIEIWRVRIENTRSEPADVSVFTYVEWVLGNYSEDFEERERNRLFTEAGFRDNYIVATKRAWRRPDLASVTVRSSRGAGAPKFIPETVSSNQTWGKWAFIAMNVPVDSFDCGREAFLGRYGDLGHPEAVKRGQCGNSGGDGRDAVGVLQTTLVLPAGGIVEFDVFVGIALHDADVSGIVARYSEDHVVDDKLAAVRSYWDSYLAKLTVTTPDRNVNHTMNTWSKYQSWVSIRTEGMASLASGGASTVCFRESCFDLFGVLPIEEDFCKLRLVYLLQHQHRDGSVVHYWEPRSDVGATTGHLDDPVWLVFALISYLKESGDLDFLDDSIKYYYSQKPATVYEHMVAALDFCLGQLGDRGLSLLGPGDWDDSLDRAGREGRGESILTSQMLTWILDEAAQLAKLKSDAPQARTWHTRAGRIRDSLLKLAWDGKWFIRAVGDSGEKIGSSSNHYGKTYLNPQSWAVISATAGDFGVEAMEEVRRHLCSSRGPTSLAPAYARPDNRIGAITRYSPGTGANGGISTLAAAWAVIAECTLGRGDRAYELLKRSLHVTRMTEQDRYAVEPFVHAEQMFGSASEDFGQGAFAWAPGVAAWMWRAVIDWIYGVRPDYDGLRIDPCVPAAWRDFTVVRPFRGACYKIHIKNPDGVQKGVRKILVDGGKTRPGNPIPDFRDGKTHEVEVEMGQP